MEEFLPKLAEILEEDEIKLEDRLEDFEEWDSLSVLSVLAMIDSDYNVMLESEALADLTTVGDLFALVESRIENRS